MARRASKRLAASDEPIYGVSTGFGSLATVPIPRARREDLQRAVRVVAEGGAWLDPAVTGRVLAIYRSAAPRGSGGGAALGALSGREREVLALIGEGKTNAEIAAALFVGEGTVKTHINHVFTKLNLRDRAAAVVFAFDHDLVSPGPPS